MYKIVRKKDLNAAVTLMEIEAPFIAKKAHAGQFIIFRIDEQGERVPLTIAGYDREKGTVTIIFQKVGFSTIALGNLNEGDYIRDFVGPLGKPTHTEGIKRVCVVGGGVGCAIALPSAAAFKEAGAEVDVIVGFRSKDIVILEDEFRAVADNMYLMTDDGSYGEHGFVTVKLQQLLEQGKKYDAVLAIGPIPMMKFVCKTTEPFGVKTMVSLNPIMIDGTGMCGGCRVTVGGETKFACVDGPEFDGHQVDFAELMSRNGTYCQREKEVTETHACRMEETVMPNMSLKKTPMPEQDPKVRARNFQEVSLGYTAEQAIEEANRCLKCKNPKCVTGCPVNIRIPDFIAKVQEGDFKAAYEIISSTNALPALSGRVCPQESQCECHCVRGIKGEPVAIGRLERFCADWYRENINAMPEKVENNGTKVAVVGSGPAGLTAASDLAKKGYAVTMFEALHTAGGVLVYGIPEFRLPKAIVANEVKKLEALGVEVMTNMVIGRVLTIDELFDMGYKAVFVGSGAGLPMFMNIPGEALKGVMSANEYLTRTNLMKAYDPAADTPVIQSKAVAVVGGGNVAMDAARCAMRLGAEHVYIVYRRGEAEMPARLEEVHHAKEEGIELKTLCNPVEILGDENGRVRGMKCVRMELGEPDASGRRRPVEIPGSEFILDVDTVVMSLGTSPNPLIRSTTPGLDTNRKGCLIVDENEMTTREGVFAGGDAVTGAATVILAMGAGKKAADAIHAFLNK